MNYETLKTELAGKQYAEAIAAGDDTAIADLLNAPTAGTISRGVISKDQFVLALQSGLASILGKPENDPVRQAFAGWLALLGMVTNIDTADAAVLTTLEQAVASGVFQQAEVDAATKRACSRAEQLFGSGVIIRQDDISFALRGDR